MEKGAEVIIKTISPIRESPSYSDPMDPDMLIHDLLFSREVPVFAYVTSIRLPHLAKLVPVQPPNLAIKDSKFGQAYCF